MVIHRRPMGNTRVDDQMIRHNYANVLEKLQEIRGFLLQESGTYATDDLQAAKMARLNAVIDSLISFCKVEIEILDMLKLETHA